MRDPILVATAMAVLLAGCGKQEKDSRGLELMPDMFHSPAAKSQDAGTVEVDGRDAQGNPVRKQVRFGTMLTPPEGTVARGAQPYQLAATDWAGARALRNPVVPTAQVLRRGQADFLTFCAPCHGRDGDAANGYIARSFSGIPSLNTLAVLQLSEGEIFHTITMGKGRMWSLRAQLPDGRRWGVVSFLKVQARAAVAGQDLAKLLPALEAEVARNPQDAALARRRDELRRIAGQAQADLSALGTAGDGHEFLPAAAPVPEYVGPSWPVPETSK